MTLLRVLSVSAVLAVARAGLAPTPLAAYPGPALAPTPFAAYAGPAHISAYHGPALAHAPIAAYPGPPLAHAAYPGPPLAHAAYPGPALAAYASPAVGPFPAPQGLAYAQYAPAAPALAAYPAPLARAPVAVAPAYQRAFAAPVAVARALPAPVAVAAPVAKAIAAPVAVAKAVVDHDAYPQYSYAYSVQDALTGDAKSQEEIREGGVVKGSYSLIEPDGTRRTVNYYADPVNGFNAVVQRDAPVAVKAPIVAKAVGPPVAYAV